MRAVDVQLYRLCDEFTEVFLCLMLLFGPWAFGTTEYWSIWTMNLAGYSLGTALLIKLALRWLKGYRPPRWVSDTPPAAASSSKRRNSRFLTSPKITAGLATLTLVILAYTLVSALNARATFRPDTLSFEYDRCIRWLPHSLDSASTWFTLWTYLGLACSFWALRDWLLGKSTGEQLAQWQKSAAAGPDFALPLPARLRRLLWLLALNGTVLAAEAIFQRLENSPKLLFLVTPQIHKTADAQFGPYAYRSNGAQYFNLLWPVCLGFWWTLNRTLGHRRKTHHFLLFCGVLMAACPIISTSRGGAFIAVGIALLAAFSLLATHFLLKAQRQENARTRRITLWALGFFFSAALGLGFALGWKALKPRLAQINDGLEGREEMYQIVRRMADDYPLFGTGPGTFENVSELYRPPGDSFWPAQVHNDWLETRITFGWMGSCVIALAFLLVLGRWFAPGGLHGGRRFMILIWLAMAGCLMHARFDFPLQIHSILFLFLTWCGVLSVLSRRP
ncbi:MAG TPA: O-antigen ligase family protein [Candidatus Binatia bacterium]|nr:O-antigen ligase family protein [Candidatus Binatia bacterium]